MVKFGIHVNWMQAEDQKPDYHLDWPNAKVYSIDLKTFLGLAMPNQCMLPCCHKLNIWLVCGWDFWARNPQIFMIPIYSATIYYIYDK